MPRARPSAKSFILSLFLLLAATFAARLIIPSSHILRLSYSTQEARYTLRWDRATLKLTGPPPPGPPAQEAKAWNFVRKLKPNEPFTIQIVQKNKNELEMRYGIVTEDAAIFWPTGAHAFTVELSYSQSPSQVASPRALLRTLDDPTQFANAHALLWETYPGREDFPKPQRHPDGTVHFTFEQLPLEFHPQSTERLGELYLRGTWKIDPAHLPAIRAMWHDRLDQTLLAIPNWLLLLISLIPPLLFWTWSRLRQSHRRRHALCLACGYDLRAGHQQCPECGSACPRPLARCTR